MNACGSDIALLLLHALPFDSRMWQAQRRLLPNATFAPDLYAFGDDIEIWARHALQLTNAKNLVVAGCSVGGSCAIEIARQAPDRVAALVLIGTKAHHNPDPEFLANALEYLRRQGVKACWDKYWSGLMDCDPQASSRAQNIALKQTPQGLENGLKAFHTRPPGDSVISRLDIPVHIVTGANDPLPGEAYASMLAETVKHPNLHIIENCGHYVPLFQPKALNAILRTVISGVGWEKSPAIGRG